MRALRATRVDFDAERREVGFDGLADVSVADDENASAMQFFLQDGGVLGAVIVVDGGVILAGLGSAAPVVLTCAAGRDRGGSI